MDAIVGPMRFRRLVLAAPLLVAIFAWAASPSLTRAQTHISCASGSAGSPAAFDSFTACDSHVLFVFVDSRLVQSGMS